MLSFLKDETCFKYDPELIIKMKEGTNFFDILGRLFSNELEEIFKLGLYKKYVRKEENIAFLKGHLMINAQIHNEVKKEPKFFCAYDDLTYNHLENQIILKATTLLISLVRFNEKIRKELIQYATLLKGEIDLVNVIPEDCDRIQFSHLNSHYETIIQFSKVILQQQFIQSIYKGLARGFNFVVNMNKVYEDFITQLVEEIIKEEVKFQNYLIEKQSRFNSLVKEKQIITRPDIILRQKNTNRFPIIIDAKYKRQENNADFYQIIAYTLAIPTAKVGCLFYPYYETIPAPVLTLDTTSFGDAGRIIKLYVFQINLWLEEQLTFEKYIIRIKQQIKEKLDKIWIK